MFSTLFGVIAAASFVAAQSSITWSSCGDRLECGRFSAPLDYANPSAGQASIFMTRYLGNGNKKKGSIFINPGGPGGSGSDFISSSGAFISSIVGPNWDIVGFDPRGVNMTSPRIDCFRTPEEENAFWSGTVPHAGFEARGDLIDRTDLQRFLSQSADLDSVLEKLYQRCVALSGDNLRYVGSAAVVRDIIGMNTALHGADADVHYWGFSYGTVLGVYLTQMFPEKIGRVVIDGVVDPVVWSTAPPHKRWETEIHDAELTLTGFAQACAAAGNTCDFAKVLNGDNTTPDNVLGAIDSLISTAYDHGAESGNVTSAALRNRIFHALYTPSTWVELATELAEAYKYYNPTSGTQARAPAELPRIFTPAKRDWRMGLQSLSKRASAPVDYSFQAVNCADAIDPSSPSVTTDEVFQELVHVTQTVSQRFGPMWGSGGLYCHRWTARAVERYTGPFNKQTKNPIITIGTEADPITAFANARHVDTLMGDSSRLILQDDFGHTTLALKSDCSREAIKKYFNDGTLPSAADNTMCGTNVEIFPGHGITKNYLAGEADHENTLLSLNNLQRHSKTLFIVSIAQAVLVVILVIALGVLYAKMRKARHGKGAKYVRTAGNEWQASSYEQPRYGDPFEPPKH